MGTPKQFLILVVDDTEIHIDILIEILASDYDVVAATDGESALKIVESNPPDLILLDVMMPGMNGYQVCEMLKSKEQTRNIPIIFVTVLGDDENEAKGLELGAIDYISKPFNPEIIRSRVRNHLELKSLRDHLGVLVQERTQKLKKSEEDLRKKAVDLGERIKELNCLFEISSLIENSNLSVEDVLQNVAEIMPAAWQYPPLACSRIVVDHKKYTTKNYKETGWRQCCDIFAGRRRLGSVEVCYVEEVPEIGPGEGVFLKEEKALLSVIAERLGAFIELKNSQRSLQESEYQVRLLLDSTAEGIFGLDIDGNCTFANRACVQILGYQNKNELIGKRMHDLIHHSHKDMTPYLGLECPSYLTYTNGKQVHVKEEVLWKKDGTNFPSEYWSYPVTEGDHIKGAVVTFLDITGRKIATDKLRLALEGIIQAMARAVESRDPYTGGHQCRVADLAVAIATEMQLPQDSVDGIRMAGMIHDLGKIAIPSEILSKPRRLTEIEFSLIKTHPSMGYEIIANIEFPWPIAQMILQHHEKMNGSGYPNGLLGEAILLEARILCVADILEAMASHRPYRPALGLEKAFEEISQHKGVLYDPQVVDALFRLNISDIHRILAKYQDDDPK